jgi:L-serine/L-threonine ammonia-lyase
MRGGRRAINEVVNEARRLGYYNATPLVQCVRNGALGGALNLDIYYKMECDQPSGSFKDRGLGALIQHARQKGPISKIITSSGGNAGYSAATIGDKVNVPVDVFCPISTPDFMQQKLKDRRANVHVGGINWNAADAFAQEALAADPAAVYIPPFDHPIIWDGHSSIVDELHSDLGEIKKPDVIIASVGGGGLLHGLQLGLQRIGWDSSTCLLAVETEGSASYAHSKRLGYVEAIKEIKTIANSLGSLRVIEPSVTSSVHTIPVVVSDRSAARGCIEFQESCDKLVEPACGATLSATHDSIMPQWIDQVVNWKLSRGDIDFLYRPVRIVAVVCGGSVVTPEALVKWKADFGL